MKKRIILSMAFSSLFLLPNLMPQQAMAQPPVQNGQTKEPSGKIIPGYIEVEGISELEIIPDEIHYMVEIREYFEEEFDGHSKPEDFKTKVNIQTVENAFRKALDKAGIDRKNVRMQEAGDYWRPRGQEFKISKTFDITLTRPEQIDLLIQNIDPKGTERMYIRSLDNKDMESYDREGRIKALENAKEKASYMAKALGRELGEAILIVEGGSPGFSAPYMFAENTMLRAKAVADYAGNSYSPEEFRIIRKSYSVTVRFLLTEPK